MRPDGVRWCRTAAVAVSGPSTTTAAADWSSASVRKRPDGERPGADVLPAGRGADQRGRPVGGALPRAMPRWSTRRRRPGCRARRRSTRARRRPGGSGVDADPKPPRRPVLASVVLPGEITSRLVPRALMLSRTSALAPSPRPTVSTTALMPMRMPSMVSAERRRWVRTASPAVRKVSRQFTVARPPVRSMTRRRRSGWCDSARAGHVRLVGDQHDRATASCSSSSRASTSAVDAGVEVAGRLVGQDHPGLGDQGPGDGDALLLAARQLTRLVVGPVGQVHRRRARPGPAALRSAGRTPA